MVIGYRAPQFFTMTLKMHIWNHGEVGVGVRMAQQNLNFLTGKKNFKFYFLLLSSLKGNSIVICNQGLFPSSPSDEEYEHSQPWGDNCEVLVKLGLGKCVVVKGPQSRRGTFRNRKKVWGSLLDFWVPKQIQNWIPLGRGNESKMLKFLQRIHGTGGRRVRRGWGTQVVIWGSLYSTEENSHE